MTNEEAIKLLNRTDCEGCEYYVPFGCEECYEAEKLGAKALEKQIPKKMVATKEYTGGCCPNCNRYVKYIRDEYLENIVCCPYCGQAIDWSEDD